MSDLTQNTTCGFLPLVAAQPRLMQQQQQTVLKVLVPQLHITSSDLGAGAVVAWPKAMMRGCTTALPQAQDSSCSSRSNSSHQLSSHSSELATHSLRATCQAGHASSGTYISRPFAPQPAASTPRTQHTSWDQQHSQQQQQ